jgi:hypothetical protein
MCAMFGVDTWIKFYSHKSLSATNFIDDASLLSFCDALRKLENTLITTYLKRNK